MSRKAVAGQLVHVMHGAEAFIQAAADRQRAPHTPRRALT